jgi:hypothetical protein
MRKLSKDIFLIEHGNDMIRGQLLFLYHLILKYNFSINETLVFQELVKGKKLDYYKIILSYPECKNVTKIVCLHSSDRWK